VLEHECGQVPILSEMKQVLEMERVDPVFRVIVDDLVGDEEGLVRVGRAESVHRETTWKTGDRAEEAFESLGEVVRDEVFVHLRDQPGGPEMG
jgi:hypothetical protein